MGTELSASSSSLALTATVATHIPYSTTASNSCSKYFTPGSLSRVGALPSVDRTSVYVGNSAIAHSKGAHMTSRTLSRSPIVGLVLFLSVSIALPWYNALVYVNLVTE